MFSLVVNCFKDCHFSKQFFIFCHKPFSFWYLYVHFWMNLRCRLWKSAFTRQILEIFLCFSGLDRGWVCKMNLFKSSDKLGCIKWAHTLKSFDILKYLFLFWNISIFWNIYMKWIFRDCRQMRLYQVSRPGESCHLEETSTGSWAALWLRCHIYFEHHIYYIYYIFIS